MIKSKIVFSYILATSMLFVGCGSTNSQEEGIEPVTNNPTINEPTVTLSAKAQLGVISGATVTIKELGVVPYKLLFTETTSDGDSIDKIGNFDAHYQALDKDKFYLFTVSGGLDKDANDDGIINAFPTINKGTFHAILKGEVLHTLKGAFKVTAATQMQYEKVKSSISKLDILEDKLDISAKEIFKDASSDILTYDPVHDKDKLEEDYHDSLLEVIKEIHEGTETVAEKKAPLANAGRDSSIMIDTAISIVGSSVDLDGNIISYAWYEGDKHLSNKRIFDYTPKSLGVHTLTLKVTDNDGLEAEDIIRITATQKPNTIPKAYNKIVESEEDSSVAIILEGSDIDSDDLVYKIIKKPLYGTLSGTSPNLTYKPNPNFFGEDRIVYMVNDGKDDSKKASISLIVNNTNDAPTAYAQTVITNQDKAKTITLKATDIDGDVIRYSILQKPEHGTVTLEDATVIYTPEKYYVGSDSFSYKIGDGSVSTTSARVDIMIKATSSMSETTPTPVAQTKEIGIKEHTSKVIPLLSKHATHYHIITFPSHGTVERTSPNPTYTPDEGYLGEDSFTYSLSNEDGVRSSVETVHLYVSKYQQLSKKYDNDNNGTFDDIYTNKYDIQGRDIFRAEDEDGDGENEYEIVTVYIPQADGTLRVEKPRDDGKEPAYEIRNSEGNVLEKFYYSTLNNRYKGTSFTKNSYNSHGDLISTTRESDHPPYHDTYTAQYEYAYDENGNMIEKKYLKEEGEPTIEYSSYDANKKLSYSAREVNGLIASECYYRYNGEGNLLNKECTFQSERYIYADNGIDVLEKEIKSSSQSMNTYIYTYDDKGRVLTEHRSQISQYESYNYSIYSTYTYDEHGNKITYTRKVTDENNEVTKDAIYYYEYDEHGNMIKARSDNNRDGTIDSKAEYVWG